MEVQVEEGQHDLELIRWYEASARPFLAGKIDDTKLAGFDSDCKRIKRAAASGKGELAVCFLGNSGVGKSTLLNAVIGGDQAVVPSGGVGPLTAQAVIVKHSLTPRLVVEYHGAVQLVRTIFGLEQMFRADLGDSISEDDELTKEEGVTEADYAELSVVDPEEEPDAGEAALRARRERRDHFRRRAQLLVTGSQHQDRELKYLLDSLRIAAGGERKWGTDPDERDAERISALCRAVGIAKKKQQYIITAENSDEFSRVLRDHATGFLAPLIKSLELGWNTPILQQGITLVDLPGVGVMRDVHREITRHWIREKANALVLIVDHRGMTESVAQALKESEFLNSLLYSADEPEDDPVVIVAVTRIDDLAHTEYQQDKTKRKYQHFLEAADTVRGSLRKELESGLESIWLSEGDVPPARRKVVQNLLSTLQVHPVSAPEFVKLRANDEDDHPFLRDEGQTGIPTFAQSLVVLAVERRKKAQARLHKEQTIFRDQVSSTIQLIESQWETDARTTEEIEALATSMEDFLSPRRKELHIRQGSYRTFLKKTIPQRIEDLVEAASGEANVKIHKYLLRLGSAHWATLRASVRRGGRYAGASNIDLPTQFALMFEEPIAEVWGKKILADIRQETREYARATVALVDEVSTWALAQGARVQPKMIEAQRYAIHADAKKLESVGKEMVNEKRDEAKAQLINCIEAPIRERCDQFVKRNLHIGPGVKQRILGVYSELAEEVATAAKAPSTRILKKLFREVEKEILDAFQEHNDPLEAVANAIVSSQESYLKRSDAQRRGKILEEVRLVISTTPELLVQSPADAP